jgi:hypothetical protein
MSKAAALEQRILRMLSDKDPDNRKHVIRMLRTFEYRHHVCMVFEPMVSTGWQGCGWVGGWGWGWVSGWVRACALVGVCFRGGRWI